MDILSITGNTNSKPTVANASTQLGKDDFLRLLTVQLRYQDSLNPLGNTEFIAQMAQFSSLEQLQNMNKTLGQNLDNEDRLHTAFKNNLATSLIGKNVEIPTSLIEFTGNGEASLAYRIGLGAVESSVRILDARGQLVRQIDIDPSSRYGGISWDGKSEAGSEVPAGAYRVVVSAEGSDGASVGAEALKSVRVQAVRNLGGEATIWADGREISFAELGGVTEIKD